MNHRIPFSTPTSGFVHIPALIKEYKVWITVQTESHRDLPGRYFVYGDINNVIAFVLAITKPNCTKRTEYLAHLEKWPLTSMEEAMQDPGTPLIRSITAL